VSQNNFTRDERLSNSEIKAVINHHHKTKKKQRILSTNLEFGPSTWLSVSSEEGRNQTKFPVFVGVSLGRVKKPCEESS
jgi:hypothetical protein